jgi:Tol biopolymer transport system component/predicted Ser/Thr protein kinase
MSDDGRGEDRDSERSVSGTGLRAGQTLGHYRIVRPLGRGGMGEVHLARDTKLDREVALKVLPADLARDPERRARFEREAKAVAALNHPNIVTVHSIEEVQGMHLITMEYVEGKTLTQLILKGGMALPGFLDVAIPLAEAMAAAHGQGITHRDLKPDNLMLGEDGRLRILDFGLAKLREETAAPTADTALPTKTMSTEPGMVLGTVAYMSPEQAEGKPIDSPSDVFSLGIVLYEMATGERPFQGDTGISIITAIVRDTPTSVTELNRSLPRHLGRIVRRCLAKDPTRRYQTALELRNELEELKEELDSGELTAPDVSVAAIRRGRWRIPAAVALGAAAVLIVIGGYQVLRRGGETTGTFRPPRAVSFDRLTEAPGAEVSPSLAPDGKWFAYRNNATGDGDIYLQAVGGANPINLTPDSPDPDTQPAFSPDGERIAFRSEREGGGIFVMGRTGESVRRITDTGYCPAWSPDGAEIAFATADFNDPAMRPHLSELWAVALDTGETRRIAAEDAIQPHWSPSGRRIAFWGVRPGSGRRDIWTVPAAGGSPVSVTDDPHLDFNPLWSPDGNHLYFVSDRGGSRNLWRVPVDEASGRTLGPFEPVTTPAQGVAGTDISRGGDQIAYTAWTASSNIQKVAFDPSEGTLGGSPEWITRGSAMVAVPSVSPSGEWFAYNLWGEQEDIFVMRSDGSGRRQLTNDLHKDRAPMWSPDGSEIAFFSDRGGTYDIWVIRPDGSGLRQLTDTPGEALRSPVWSPDGSWMVYNSDEGSYLFEPEKAWDQQTPVALAPPEDAGASILFRSWSPDGKWLAGFTFDADGIVVYSLERQEYRRLTEEGRYPVWLREGHRLLVSAGSGALHLLDAATGESRELLDPGESGWYSVAGTSPEDREIYVLRVSANADIWLLTLGN